MKDHREAVDDMDTTSQAAAAAGTPEPDESPELLSMVGLLRCRTCLSAPAVGRLYSCQGRCGHVVACGRCRGRVRSGGGVRARPGRCGDCGGSLRRDLGAEEFREVVASVTPAPRAG